VSILLQYSRRDIHPLIQAPDSKMSNGTYLKGDGEILQIEEVAGQSPSASVGSMTITPELLVQVRINAINLFISDQC
jgi:hypothetical protein